MGYLVYCTTCNGTMSNNASTCPHCGESGFIKRFEDVGYKKCKYCNGTGKTTPLSGYTAHSCDECRDGMVSYVKAVKTIDKRKRV